MLKGKGDPSTTRKAKSIRKSRISTKSTRHLYNLPHPPSTTRSDPTSVKQHALGANVQQHRISWAAHPPKISPPRHISPTPHHSPLHTTSPQQVHSLNSQLSPQTHPTSSISLFTLLSTPSIPSHLKSSISHALRRSSSTFSHKINPPNASSSFKSTTPSLFQRRRIELMTANDTTKKFLETAKHDPDFAYKDQINDRTSHKLPFDSNLAGCHRVKNSIRQAMLENSPHLISMFYNMPNSNKTRYDWVAMLCYLSVKNDQKQLFLLLDNFLVQVCKLPPLIQDRLGFLRTHDFSTQQQQMNQYRNEVQLIRDAQRANELELLRVGGHPEVDDTSATHYKRYQYLSGTNLDKVSAEGLDSEMDSSDEGVKKPLELPTLTKEEEMLQEYKWKSNRISPHEQDKGEHGLQGYDQSHDDLSLMKKHTQKSMADELIPDVRPLVEFSATGGSRAEIQGDGKLKLIIDVNQDTSFDHPEGGDFFGAFDPELLHYETPEDEANAKRQQAEEKKLALQKQEDAEQSRIRKLTEMSFTGETALQKKTNDSTTSTLESTDELDELDQLQQLLAFQNEHLPNLDPTIVSIDPSPGHTPPSSPSRARPHGAQPATAMNTKEAEKVNKLAQDRMAQSEQGLLRLPRLPTEQLSQQPQQPQQPQPRQQKSNKDALNDPEYLQKEAMLGSILQQDPRGILNSYSLSLILECLSGIGDHKKFLSEKKSKLSAPLNTIAAIQANSQKASIGKFSNKAALAKLAGASSKPTPKSNESQSSAEDTDPVLKLRKSLESALLQDLMDQTPEMDGFDSPSNDLDLFGDGESRIDGFLEDDFVESRSLLFLEYALENGLAVTSQCFDVVLRGTSLAIARDSSRLRVKKAIIDEQRREAARQKALDEGTFDLNDKEFQVDNEDNSDEERAQARNALAVNDNDTDDEPEYGRDDFIGVTGDRLALKEYQHNLSRTRARRTRMSKLQTKVDKLGNRDPNGELAKESVLSKIFHDSEFGTVTQRALDKAGRDFNDGALSRRHQRILIQTQRTLRLMSTYQMYPSSATWTYVLRAHFFRLSTMTNQIDKNICFREQILPLYSQIMSINSVSPTSLTTLATIAASAGQISLFEQFYQSAVSAQLGLESHPTHQILHAYRMTVHLDAFLKNTHPTFTSSGQIYETLRDTLSHCNLSRLSPALAHTILAVSRTVPPTDCSISTLQPIESNLLQTNSLDHNDPLPLQQLRNLVPHLTPKQKKTLHQIQQYYSPLKTRKGTLSSIIFASHHLFQRNVVVPAPYVINSTTVSTQSVIKDNHANTFALAPMTPNHLSFNSYKRALSTLNTLAALALEDTVDGVVDNALAASSTNIAESTVYSALLSNLHRSHPNVKDRRLIDVSVGDNQGRTNVWVPDVSLLLADFLGTTSFRSHQPPNPNQTGHNSNARSDDEDTGLPRPAFDYDTLNEVIVAHVSNLNSITNLFVDFRHRYNHYLKQLAFAQELAGDSPTIPNDQLAAINARDAAFRPDLDGFLVGNDFFEPLNLADPQIQRQLVIACTNLLSIDLTSPNLRTKTGQIKDLAVLSKLLASHNVSEPINNLSGYDLARWLPLLVSDMIAKGDIDGTSLMNYLTQGTYSDLLTASVGDTAAASSNQYGGSSRRPTLLAELAKNPHTPDTSSRQSVEDSIRILWRALHTDLTEWCAPTRITPYHVMASVKDFSLLSRKSTIPTDLNEAVPITETTISHLLSLYLSIPKSTSQVPAYDTQYSNHLDSANPGVRYAFQLLAHLDKHGHTITSQHLNTVLQFCHSPQDILSTFGAFSKFNALATTTTNNSHIANSLRMLLLSFLNFDSPSLFKQWAFASTQTLSNISSQLRQQHIYFNELPSTFIGSTLSRLQHSLNQVSTHNLSDHTHKLDSSLVKYRQSLYTDPEHRLTLFNSTSTKAADGSLVLDSQYYSKHNNGVMPFPAKLNNLESQLLSHTQQRSISTDDTKSTALRPARFYETVDAKSASKAIPEVISIKDSTISTSNAISLLKVMDTDDTLLQYFSVFGNSYNNNIHDMPLQRMCLDLYINNKVVNLHEIDFAYSALTSTENINDFDGNLHALSVYKPSSIRNRFSTMLSLDVNSATGNTLHAHGSHNFSKFGEGMSDAEGNIDTLDAVFPHFNPYGSSSETEHDHRRFDDTETDLTDNSEMISSSKGLSKHRNAKKAQNTPAYRYSSIPCQGDDDFVPMQTWATQSGGDYLFGDQSQPFSATPLSLQNSLKDDSTSIHGLAYIKPRQNRFIKDSLSNVTRQYGHPNAMTAFESFIAFTAPAMMTTYFEFSKRLAVRNYIKDPLFQMKQFDEDENDVDDDYDGMIESKFSQDQAVFDYMHENLHTKQIDNFDIRSIITTALLGSDKDPHYSTSPHTSSTQNDQTGQLASIQPSKVKVNMKSILSKLVENKRYYENYTFSPETINAGLEPEDHINTMLVRSVDPNPQIHDTLLTHLQSSSYFPEAQMPTIVPVAIFRQCITTTLNWLSQFGADLQRSYALMALWQVQSGLSLPFDLTKTLPKSIVSNMSPELKTFVKSITLNVVTTNNMSEAVHTTHNLANNFYAQLSTKLHFMQTNPNSYEFNYMYKPIYDAQAFNTGPNGDAGAAEPAKLRAQQIAAAKESEPFLLTQLDHVIPGRMFTLPGYLDIDSPQMAELVSLLNNYVVESAPEKYNPASDHTSLAKKRTIVPQTIAQELCSPNMMSDPVRTAAYLMEQEDHGYTTRDFNPFKAQQMHVQLPVNFDSPQTNQKKDFLAAQLLQLWYNVGSVPCPTDQKEVQFDEMWKLVNAPEMMLTSNDQLKKHVSKNFAQLSNIALDQDGNLVDNPHGNGTDQDQNVLYKHLTQQQFLNNIDSNLYVCAHHLDILNSTMLNSLSILPFPVVSNRESNVMDLNRLLTDRR